MTFLQAVGLKRLDNGESLDERRASWMLKFLDAFAVLIQHSAVRDVAVYGVQLQEPTSNAETNPCLILSNLDLVDTGKLTWRQVIELRKGKWRPTLGAGASNRSAGRGVVSSRHESQRGRAAA